MHSVFVCGVHIYIYYIYICVCVCALVFETYSQELPRMPSSELPSAFNRCTCVCRRFAKAAKHDSSPQWHCPISPLYIRCLPIQPLWLILCTSVSARLCLMMPTVRITIVAEGQHTIPHYHLYESRCHGGLRAIPTKFWMQMDEGSWFSTASPWFSWLSGF